MFFSFPNFSPLYLTAKLPLSPLFLARADSIDREKCLLARRRFLLPLNFDNTDELEPVKNKQATISYNRLR